MSDSDDDSLQNNVFTFQNENMTICARGPNANSANITGSSLRNNAFTSTMPVNFGRQRYAGSNFDQRNAYYRRDTSPMSLRSVADFGPCSFSHSTYRNGYQRSVFNGRGGSVISDRSIDSAASISAADIAFAFKNREFNKDEMMILKEAYSKLIRSRQRKRIEKRRNMRLFLKGIRHKSRDDSSERESDSSISNDDCRSIKSTLNKELIPGLRNMREVSHFSTNVHQNAVKQQNEMFRDCTDSIKQNTMRKMFSNSSRMTNFGAQETIQETPVITEQNQSSIKVQNTSVMTQKERFKKGFLLPSQRFNKSVVGQAQANDKGKNIGNTRKTNLQTTNPSKVAGPESDCDSDGIHEIFPQKDTQQEVNVQRKRTLDTEGVCYSDKKKSKLDSPSRLRSLKPLESTCNTDSNSKSNNDFIFAKPKMPIKKGFSKKDFATEKLLAKCNVPPIAETDDFDNVTMSCSKSKSAEKNETEAVGNDTHSEILHSTCEVSMRPSFIKRKLFTQTLDVAENKNLSSDSIAVNSPQSAYSESMREKNKTRKLVTSQSCLSREVMGEDNNVLDLIHKIVPPDQINLTNVTNKTDLCNNESNKDDNNEKWDVTAIIASGNFQDLSDTYTDEEIFVPTHQKEPNKPKNSVNNLKEIPQCKIVVDKLLTSTLNKLLKDNKNYELPHFKLAGRETYKKRVTDCVKSFWDTDFESDVENNASSWKTNIPKNQVSTTQIRKNDQDDILNTSNKKPSVSKGILTLRNFHKDSKFSVYAKSQTNAIDRDKQVPEIDHSKSEVAGKVDITKVGKSKKETNTKSQTGNKKKDIAKENVPVTKTQKESGRTPKSKVCSNCIYTDKPKDTNKKLNAGVKLTKSHENQETNNNNSKLTGKVSQKSKDSNIISAPLSKQAKKDSSKKITNSGPKNDAKSQKPVNIRVQPKRRSKEKSFVVQSPKPKTKTNNTKAQNNKSIIKSTKESASKNNPLNMLNTKSIRSSREKLAFDSSGRDMSNMNISNLSNRSIRVPPKRKSKEKSFVVPSPKPKQKTYNTREQNNKSIIKSTKEAASKNISLNMLNTRSTRSSREILSFNSSGCDKSTMNISNISNRSLRWRQRKINEYK